MFQCMALPTEGAPHLLTRAPDRCQAQQTSILDDEQIHIWADRESANPAAALYAFLDELGLLDGRLGIETQTVGRTAYNGKLVESVLDGRCKLIEASDLVSNLRREKSATEIAYHRRAAQLSDDALDAAFELTEAGAFEGDILAAMQGRCSMVTATMPAMSSSLVRARQHYCAAIKAAGGIWMRATNSP